MTTTKNNEYSNVVNADVDAPAILDKVRTLAKDTLEFHAEAMDGLIDAQKTVGEESALAHREMYIHKEANKRVSELDGMYNESIRNLTKEKIDLVTLMQETVQNSLGSENKIAELEAQILRMTEERNHSTTTMIQRHGKQLADAKADLKREHAKDIAELIKIRDDQQAVLNNLLKDLEKFEATKQYTQATRDIYSVIKCFENAATEEDEDGYSWWKSFFMEHTELTNGELDNVQDVLECIQTATRGLHTKMQAEYDRMKKTKFAK